MEKVYKPLTKFYAEKKLNFEKVSKNGFLNCLMLVLFLFVIKLPAFGIRLFNISVQENVAKSGVRTISAMII